LMIKLLEILPEQSVNHKPKQYNKHHEQNHDNSEGFHCFYNGCCDILHFSSTKFKKLKNYKNLKNLPESELQKS